MARLRTQLGDDLFNSWFQCMELDGLDGGTISLSVPTKFLKSWITSRYGDRLLTLWQEEDSKVARIEVRVRRHGEAFLAKKEAAPRPAAPAGAGTVWPDAGPGQPTGANRSAGKATTGSGATPAAGPTSGSLDARLTFTSYVVGRSNVLAHAAAWRVASAEPGDAIEFNPLYIHGAVGVGKTHILNAIAWEIARRRGGRKVMMLSAVRFMTGFVDALKVRELHAFKESFSEIDVLLIDDIQFLRGDKVQQEFCHIFNLLDSGKRQVIVTGDVAPSRLESLDDRMRSRLSGGLVAQVGPVDLEMRRGILDERARQMSKSGGGVDLPARVLDFIARRVQGSGRDLEGVLNRLVAQNKLGSTPISIDAASEIIKDFVSEAPPRQIMIEDVMRAVVGHFNVSRADLISPRRHKSVVYPRQVGMYLAKVLTTRSLPEIGRKFGGRDHTTVLHAVRKIERLATEDKSTRDVIETLKDTLTD